MEIETKTSTNGSVKKTFVYANGDVKIFYFYSNGDRQLMINPVGRHSSYVRWYANGTKLETISDAHGKFNMFTNSHGVVERSRAA